MHPPDRSQFQQYLQQLPYFAGLDAATLHRLAAAATWHEFAPGGIIFLEGETSNGLYAMHAGWAKVVKSSPDGREQVLRYIGPGELFNEIGIFLVRPNPATAVALEHTELWLLRRQAFSPLLADHPTILLQIMENMADRIAYLAGLVADLSLNTVEVRLARLLLDEATGETLQRQPWLTQAELAARLGTVPEVLSRVLRSLAEAGLIRVERRQVVILNRQGLEGRAGDR